MASHKAGLELAITTFLLILPLLVNSIAISSPFSNSIPSYGTIAYSHPAVLFFKSSWESPVEFATPQKIRFTGADQGFDWARISHMVQYDGGQLGIDVESRIDNFAHSGSRSLYQAKLTKDGNWRNQLVIYTDDNVFGTKIFVRRWLYYPANFDLPDKGWMGGIFSHRELNSNPQFTVGMDIWRNSNLSNDLFWWMDALIYDDSGSYERVWFRYNTKVPVPRGRWFKLEEYIERDPTNGAVKVWVDDQLLFDVSGVMTKTSWGQPIVGNMVGKVMVGSENYGYTYPYYHWLDDLEIWDGIPQ